MNNHQKGGLKAKKTMLERYGSDYYQRIGNKGGNPMLLKIRDRNNGKGEQVEK